MMASINLRTTLAYFDCANSFFCFLWIASRWWKFYEKSEYLRSLSNLSRVEKFCLSGGFAMQKFSKIKSRNKGIYFSSNSSHIQLNQIYSRKRFHFSVHRTLLEDVAKIIYFSISIYHNTPSRYSIVNGAPVRN